MLWSLELSVVEAGPPDAFVVPVVGVEPAHWDELRPTLTQLFEPVLPVWTTPTLPVLEFEVELVPPEPDDELPFEEVGWEPWHWFLPSRALMQLDDRVLPV